MLNSREYRFVCRPTGKTRNPQDAVVVEWWMSGNRCLEHPMMHTYRTLLV